MKFIAKLFSVFCIAFFISSCGGSSSPEAAAKKYVDAVYAGDSDTVISMVHISDKHKDEPGLKDMVSGKVKQAVMHDKENAEKNGGVKGISVGEPKYSEDKKTAEVLVTISFKNSGKPKQELVRLIDTDNGWKLKF
ncbi:DUF4878 domain-containing protein [Snodgrassella sp. CFCC 13594]|uniref:DUF4878 domain-containing protein n=1 Tax=Snodgrassella sp. CFCC 13594 TaxID=1775559 RepID=UPI0008367D84|nr:DUF4878 domain-containing protein [Snodgrassella sp. CFCC 13594]